MRAGLLFLHGFTGSAASWSAIAEPIPGERAVLAPALVGHGDAVDVAAQSFEGEVDRIAYLAAGRPWHVVGYSLGGRLAIGLLVRHPELCVSAVLIGAQPGLRTEEERRARRAADERWCAILAERGLSAFVSEWESQPLFASQLELPAAVLAAQRAERLNQSAAGLVRSLRTTGLGVMPSYSESLRNVRAPVSLVAGERDTKFTAIAGDMAAILPNAAVEVVAGAGHNVVLERPRCVRAMIERMLDREVV